MKVKKLGILPLLVLVTLCLLAGTAYADVYQFYTDKVIPAAGLHTDLTASAPKPTSNYCKNWCQESSDPDRYWDFWVDQQNNGQVIPTTSISVTYDWSKIVAYNKTLNGYNVQPRASTRSLFDPALTVTGPFFTSYTP